MSALSRDALRAHLLNDWLDADGRPLGEYAAPGPYASVRDEARCPYPGSRHGMPMNRGALRQVMGCWEALRALLQSLSAPHTTVHGAWRVTTAATIGPLLLPRPTPTLFSALYKSCVGFHQCLTFLLLADDAVADTPLSGLAAPEDFLRWLEHEGWLVGQHQGCAGPAHLIQALYSDLCGDQSAEAPSGWDAIPGWEAGTAAAMRWQAEALQERIGAPGGPLSRSAAPWLSVVLLRPGLAPEDVSRLWPAALRSGRGRFPG